MFELALVGSVLFGNVPLVINKSSLKETSNIGCYQVLSCAISFLKSEFRSYGGCILTEPILLCMHFDSYYPFTVISFL